MGPSSAVGPGVLRDDWQLDRLQLAGVFLVQRIALGSLLMEVVFGNARGNVRCECSGVILGDWGCLGGRMFC